MAYATDIPDFLKSGILWVSVVFRDEGGEIEETLLYRWNYLTILTPSFLDKIA